MKSVYVSQLDAAKPATGVFLVQHKEIRYKKGKAGAGDSGEPFLSLTLSDRTGEIDAKMWDNVAGVMYGFEQDDFIEVKGILQIHNGRKQLTVHRLQKAEQASVDLADFMPASARDPEEMLAELRSLICAIENRHLRALLELVFSDAELVAKFKQAPAGKSVHHACLGGLLEHVLSVCRMARFAAPHYKVDADLLLSGAMLHDIGKIEELSWNRSFGYTTEGQLLGHIVIGVRLVEEKVKQLPEFPARLWNLVAHMILSHHGELEFGSPKVPAFPEAVLLHHLEDLDAKMDCMRRLLEQDGRVEGYWTGYSNPLDRALLKKDDYLSAPGADAPLVPPPPAPPPTLEDVATRLKAHFRREGT